MMPLSIKLAGLVLCAAVAAAALQERQLHSLPPQGSTSSATTTTTASSSTTTSTTATTMSTHTGPTRWELSTVFTQPTDCLGGITQYAGGLSTLGYWLNIPYPAPGVTVTSCFPPALVASVTASVDLPPYEQLVCPDRWESFDYNSTYRICCPKDFGLYAPGLVSNKDRPGLGAWCTSWVPPGTHAALTRYYTDGGSSLIDTTLGTAENWLVQATAFDGIIATNVPTSTSTSSSSTSSKTVSTPKSTPATTTTTTTTTAKPSWTGPTAVSDLPQCGQTCINNMLAKHRELGCGDKDVACMYRAPNFNYGVRDCANGACSNADRASTVISFETSYWCPSFMATGTNSPTQAPTPTPTAISDLPPCGQTCMNNMIAQYSQLGCRSPDPACLCKNANFGYGVRDCANGACGAAVAPTVTNFASSHYCSPTPGP
ncbi:GPI-anchored CFEM domain protein [Metarhizium anisopliae]|nr:GPI-anchored CFEM domain protein [Metarhizium anisopliae]